MKKRIALTTVVFAALVVVPAFAITVVVPAKDASPTVVTRPTLVNRDDVVKIRERSDYPDTKVRFKVYPDTYGFRPTSSRCQGQFFTARHRTNSSGSVVIRLQHPKPLCRGVMYQAEALIGSGDVPDKFAHFCVRGRTSPTGSRCSDAYNYG